MYVYIYVYIYMYIHKCPACKDTFVTAMLFLSHLSCVERLHTYMHTHTFTYVCMCGLTMPSCMHVCPDNAFIHVSGHIWCAGLTYTLVCQTIYTTYPCM